MTNAASQPAIGAPAPLPAAGTADALVVRVCVECGDEFSPPSKGPGQHKKFCKDKCRFSFGNREKARGGVLATVAQVYAAKRHAKTDSDRNLRSDCWKEMTRMLTIFNNEDRRAGRLDRLPDYVRGMNNIDNNYQERRRWKS